MLFEHSNLFDRLRHYRSLYLYSTKLVVEYPNLAKVNKQDYLEYLLVRRDLNSIAGKLPQ